MATGPIVYVACRLPTSAFEGGHAGSSASQPSTPSSVWFPASWMQISIPADPPRTVRLPSITGGTTNTRSFVSTAIVLRKEETIVGWVDGGGDSLVGHR
ncbi:UPF0489 protein C5orf22 isoform X2 [Apis mellifera caucasica]|nr:UPF0489 protein C5orf22 isoform X2 [Apis mellifera caucasica]KAG9434390.1 UPF0489 protein C5orf22 isoform X2 [Apis mellifera carnica]